MKKLYRYIKFYLKTAFRNILRHLGMTFSAAFAVSITLILISAFMLLNSNIGNVTYTIEDELTIRASVDTIIKGDQLETLKHEIEQVEGVSKVIYSSGSEELEAYRNEYSDENNLFSMYDGVTSPVRDAFIIEMQDGKVVERAASTIRKMNGIVSAEYGGSSTDELLSGMEMIRSGSLIFIIFLLLIAMFLIANKIKMSILTRREEIAIMRFVGTSNFSVKLPMMLEGMFIGFLGAVLPMLLTVFGYQQLYEAMHGVLLSDMLKLQPVFPLTMQISLFLMGLGMLVGLFGGFVSTTRYLRWKR